MAEQTNSSYLQSCLSKPVDTIYEHDGDIKDTDNDLNNSACQKEQLPRQLVYERATRGEINDGYCSDSSGTLTSENEVRTSKDSTLHVNSSDSTEVKQAPYPHKVDSHIDLNDGHKSTDNYVESIDSDETKVKSIDVSLLKESFNCDHADANISLDASPFKQLSNDDDDDVGDDDDDDDATNLKSLHGRHFSDGVSPPLKTDDCSETDFIATTDIHIVKEGLIYSHETIIENLKTAEIIARLYATNVIVRREKEELDQDGKNRGNSYQGDQLMNCIMSKPDDCIRNFLKVLRGKQSHLYQQVEDNISGMLCGTIDYHRQIQDIKQELVQVYNFREFHLIEALPGESLVLDLQKHELVMPPLFTTTVKYINKKIVRNTRPQSKNFIYNSKYYEEIDAMLYDLHKDEDARIIVCTGHAGCGKTVLVHRIVCSWMNPKSVLHQKFMVVFAIAVRHVYTKFSFRDMLSKSTLGQGFVKDELLEPLHKYMTDHKTAENVLVILDGLDEVDIPHDCDLHRLIRGEIYKGVKLFVTARPEARVFKLMSNFFPDFKVVLEGTTKTGVHAYLKAIIANETGPNDEQLEQIVKQCESHMFDFKLLQVPLYLALVAYVFDEHWVKHASFAKFEVPTTTTKLFNAFMRIVLKVWLKRLSREEEAMKLEFEWNPLSKLSIIPIDIKQKIHVFGHLSYDTLIKHKYDFTEDDLETYFISEKDVSESGLFCITEKSGKMEFFFRHRLLQEYFAALYLVKAQFGELSFSSQIKAIQNSDTCCTLQDAFKGLELTLQFVCGIDPEFAAQIFEKIKGKVGVANQIQHDQKGVNLFYEAQLYTEASDESLTHYLKEMLMQSIPVDKENYSSISSSLTRLQSMIYTFSSTQCVILMKKWFGLHVQKELDSWKIIPSQMMSDNNEQQKICFPAIHKVLCFKKLKGKSSFEDINIISPTESLEMETMNAPLYFTSTRFAFQDIECLSIQRSYIADVRLLCKLFPCVKKLTINKILQILDEDILESNKDFLQSTMEESSLQIIDMSTQIGSILPKSSVVSLFQQSKLEVLKINLLDFLFSAKSINIQPCWDNLNQLNFVIGSLYDGNGNNALPGDISSFTWLLQFTPLLGHLRFGCHSNHTSSCSRNELLLSIGKNLPELESLELWGILQDEIDCEMLCTTLPQLKLLNMLGLGYEEIGRSTGCLASTLSELGHVKKFNILHGGYQEQAVLVCNNMKQNYNMKVSLGVENFF